MASAVIAAVSVCLVHNSHATHKHLPKFVVTSHTIAETTSAQKPQATHARFVAVGDMLIHDDIYKDAQTSSGYDFSSILAPIAPIISSSDFAVLNQEAVLGGEKLGLAGFSGPNKANAPQQLADNEYAIGFNIFQLANNHVWDRGLAGLTAERAKLATLKGTIVSGAYTSQAQRDKIPVIERNGITLAYLSYTYGTNIRAANSYNANIINRELIRRDVSRAKKQADVVVVGLHWGTERVRMPNAFQKSLATYIAGLGVDMIIGSHPHVLQSPEWITGNNGHRTLVMYSLGNFLSIHTEVIPHTLTGGILGVDITKDTNGKIDIQSPFIVPTWTYFDSHRRNFRVLPLDQTTQTQFAISGQDITAYRVQVSKFLKSTMPTLEIRSIADFSSVE